MRCGYRGGKMPNNPPFEQILAELDAGIEPAAKNALTPVADELLRQSSEEVPLDTGTLQGSGRVDVFPDRVEVGYHTPYAHRLHEHPEYNFKNGRKGKYLEDPIKRSLGKLENIFGTKLVAQMQSKSGSIIRSK